MTQVQTIKNEFSKIEIGDLNHGSFREMLENQFSSSKKIIIVDENTHDYCLEKLITSFETLKDAEVMMLPAGEENKVLEICFQVWEAMSEYKVNRNDLIINLGGGMVLDTGGFIASVFKRGVTFIHIPTTLLSMVDASLGGKNGIDLGVYKNQIGTFQNPHAIFIDTSFLQTLPEIEWLNGSAEILKHALLESKKAYQEFKNIKQHDELANHEMIQNSVLFKMNIVAKDPFDLNERKALNLGHTIGHGIEGYFLNEEPIHHGIAVAMGLLAESNIAMQLDLLDKETYFDIENTIFERFPLTKFTKKEMDAIAEICMNDKKNDSNKILAVLLCDFGRIKLDVPIDKENIIGGLKRINELA